MPENFSYTPDTPDEKLYTKGRFSEDIYEKAYNFRKNPPKNTKEKVSTPAISRVRAEAIARKNEQAEATKLLSWIDSGIVATTDTPITINESYGWVHLEGTWNKSEGIFRGKYTSSITDSFEWVAKMTSVNGFPVPIEGRITRRDGTVLLWRFDTKLPWTLLAGTITKPDGSATTGEFGYRDVPTRIVSSTGPKETPSTKVAPWESPNPILANTGRIDPKARVDRKISPDPRQDVAEK